MHKSLVNAVGIIPVKACTLSKIIQCIYILRQCGKQMCISTLSQVAAHILPVGDHAMLITVNFFLWKCILYS